MRDAAVTVTTPPYASWEKCRLQKVVERGNRERCASNRAPLQECGWEWSGMTSPEGSTAGTMKGPSTSHAGTYTEQRRRGVKICSSMGVC